MIEFLKPPRPTRREISVITVRVPVELHSKLSDLAHENRVSLNTVCLTALDGLIKAHEAEVKLTTEPLRIAGRA